MIKINKRFVDYFNEFYGPDGLYPGSDKKITAQQIQKGFNSLLKKRNCEYEFEGDSVDRELIRDEMIEMGMIDPDYSVRENRYMRQNRKRTMLESKLKTMIRPIVRNVILQEGIWPQSKLSSSFEFMLASELKKNYKGFFYVIGYDLYYNDQKLFKIDKDRDSVNSILRKIGKILSATKK